MKLKFEHLIDYLPYELKGFCTDDIQCVEVMNGLQKLCDGDFYNPNKVKYRKEGVTHFRLLGEPNLPIY